MGAKCDNELWEKRGASEYDSYFYTRSQLRPFFV